jgi:hypothetical protein
MTLPVIHLLAKGDAACRRPAAQGVAERHVSREDWRELRAMLTHARSIDYAQRLRASSWTAPSGLSTRSPPARPVTR